MTNQIVTTFNRSMGNGIKAGEALCQAIDHVVEHQDTTVIVKMINAAKAKKDSLAEKAVRTTFGAVYVGSKINKTKNGTISIKIKDSKLSNSAITTLKEISGNTSIRGANWAKAFKPEADNTPVELDYKKKAASLVKQGYSVETLIAALRAL